jgi:THO complex subunit 5
MFQGALSLPLLKPQILTTPPHTAKSFQTIPVQQQEPLIERPNSSFRATRNPNLCQSVLKKKMSNDAVPQRLRQLRESLAGIYAMKQETATSDDDIRNALTTCALQITSFKRLSRKVYQQKNDHLQEVQVAKKRVEETSLRLQNLQYEKNQLLNEIRRCRDFRTKETDNVDLMPLTNYYKEKGIKQPKTNSKKKDADADHKMHLERLAHELTVRKRLAEELDSLQEQTKQVDSKTSFKIKFLSELTSRFFW